MVKRSLFSLSSHVDAYVDLCEGAFYACKSVRMNMFYTLVLPVMMPVVSADVLDTGQQVVQELRRQKSKENLISF